ncbi:PHD finger protein ALFIN-LIKE 8 isoform X2 [Cajanus cajan]|uniref:PHD finger protein ALFIN-LIKE 8 isoform X2 n=1 Tax=Cajanus cajan TaxID=3821 RepID=UPI00098DA844|nr:PHD finger protein ALFIN-LIKE 8 isoform X2 [Cajanus cajan]
MISFPSSLETQSICSKLRPSLTVMTTKPNDCKRFSEGEVMIRRVREELEGEGQLKEKENLCLYGLRNQHWKVNLTIEEVPLELPEPVLDINFVGDDIQEKDWLSLVIVHSYTWLFVLAFYFGARLGFDKIYT